jgi:para-aminobenzoate synthetase component 1
LPDPDARIYGLLDEWIFRKRAECHPIIHQSINPLIHRCLMRPLIHEIQTTHTPESLAAQLSTSHSNVVLLRTSAFDSPSARYSFVAANPLLTFRSFGSRCEISRPRIPDASPQIQFGDPCHLLDSLMSRFELLDEIDLPFPLGGCFGFWGYDLKNFTEPKLPRRAVNDLELPDCHVGFYDSLAVFDHQLGKVSIVSTGLDADGARSEKRANEQMDFWKSQLSQTLTPALSLSERERENVSSIGRNWHAVGPGSDVRKFPPLLGERDGVRANVISNFSKNDFISAVERAQRYIRAGDIYQVNLSHRLTVDFCGRAGSPLPAAGRTQAHEQRAWSDAPCLHANSAGWELFENLSAVSPAPFAAFLDCGEFQIASSSPEQFLRMSGSQIVTRPIKGTRPRDADPTRDAQLAYELQTNAKELAELVMITDLLRNDIGKVCEYGSVQTPEIAKLEKFAQVQHLVSTVEGRLRKEMTHFAAFASAFPGGSITGAPKFRAMEIIDELEPVSRGPYCGAIGYLGFNRESQLSITIRTAICRDGLAHFNVGAGIVADSNPEAEYEETLAKAAGFLTALSSSRREEAHSKIENGKLI